MMSRNSRAVFAGLTLFAVTATGMPVAAQSSGDEARLRKVESEIRALQRKVFPGGDGKFFEPQITGTPASSTTNSTSTTAVTDILVRMDAMEAQIAALTAQTEENSNAMLQLTNRIVALENGTTSTTGATPNTGIAPAAVTSTQAASSTPTPVSATTPSASGPTPERIAAVQQVSKPQTEDAADDEYSYGYRLWNAGFYPEAQQQLTMFVEKYPSHWRTTYGRNLLGRAYLDDGKAQEAAPWFLRNYQANKQDARAPDSLLYLAETMIALRDTDRACIALAEFGETYPALATGRLSSQYERNVGRVSCN